MLMARSLKPLYQFSAPVRRVLEGDFLGPRFIQITARFNRQIGIQFKRQRVAGGDFQVHNLVVADFEQMFAQRAQAVAMGGDDQIFAGAQARRNLGLSIGQHPVKRGL
jgi:hypothetical protein